MKWHIDRLYVKAVSVMITLSALWVIIPQGYKWH